MDCLLFLKIMITIFVKWNTNYYKCWIFLPVRPLSIVSFCKYKVQTEILRKSNNRWSEKQLQSLVRI